MTQPLTRLAVCASLIFILGLIIPLSAQRPNESITVPLSPAPYRAGERLTYNVSYSNFISAAHVELQVLDRGIALGRDSIRLRAQVRTSGLISAALMSLNHDYLTYIDPSTGLPFRTHQTIREALRTIEKEQDFTDAGTTTKMRENELPGTFDLVSIVYRLRALPLTQGSSYRFSVRADKDYRVELRVSGQQRLQTNVGWFNTLVSQVRIKNDSEVDDYDLRIYFSEDERHIPVLITAKLRAGEIRAELAGSDFVQPAVQPTPTPTPAQPATSNIQPPLSSSVPTTNAEDLEGLPFKVGEQLNYQIFLASLPQVAGTATFQVRGHSRYFDRDGLMFTVRAQTTNAAQRLFSANDQITTYVDTRGLLPYRVEMNLVEGRRRRKQTLTINQDYGAATTEGGEKIDIPVGTHEFVSLFYVVRTFNLTPPKRNALSLLVDNEAKTLFITALEKETIQLGGQSIPAIQVSLTTDDPQPDKYQFRAWISDDARRLPLRLSATTEIGPIRADLAIIPLSPQ